MIVIRTIFKGIGGTKARTAPEGPHFQRWTRSLLEVGRVHEQWKRLVRPALSARSVCQIRSLPHRFQFGLLALGDIRNRAHEFQAATTVWRSGGHSNRAISQFARRYNIGDLSGLVHLSFKTRD